MFGTEKAASEIEINFNKLAVVPSEAFKRF
jgi:hypothetical protein